MSGAQAIDHFRLAAGPDGQASGPDGQASGHRLPITDHDDRRPSMQHWISTAATLRGDRATNQDQVVMVEGAVAVLDGATSWLHAHDGPDPKDGGWYARRLGQALTVRLPGHDRPLTEILAEAIAHVRDVHALAPGDSPYSTASVARWAGDHLDVLVLGDSPALIQLSSGEATLVCDDRLSTTAPAERAAYREHLRSDRGFDTTFADLIADVQRTERLSFNQPHGFWVAEADPAAASHAICRTLPIEELDAVVLMSDGAAAGVTDYELTDWAGLPVELGKSGVSDWLRRVHATELSDPNGRRWPRTKKHDDKTIIKLDRVAA